MKKSVNSIAQIISTSFLPAYAAMKNGKEWADPRLNKAMEKGRLIIRPLAASTEVDGLFYDVSQISIPTTWTHKDGAKNEQDRIRLCANLLQNTLQIHEDILCSALEHHNLIVSSDFRVERGDILPVKGHPSFYFLTYTAVVGVPKNVDLRNASIIDHTEDPTEPIQLCHDSDCPLHQKAVLIEDYHENPLDSRRS